jgi:DNA-binding MarR family transcriptional regulator
VVGQSGAIGEALFALGLTGASTLATLERTGPRRLTDLAGAEEVTQPSMTALVTQLEDLGLAERRRDPGDARVVLVAITPTGREQLRTMRRAGASVLSGLIDMLGEREAGALRAALPALLRLTELAAERLDSRAGPLSGVVR